MISKFILRNVSFLVVRQKAKPDKKHRQKPQRENTDRKHREKTQTENAERKHRQKTHRKHRRKTQTENTQRENTDRKHRQKTQTENTHGKHTERKHRQKTQTENTDRKHTQKTHREKTHREKTQTENTERKHRQKTYTENTQRENTQRENGNTQTENTERNTDRSTTQYHKVLHDTIPCYTAPHATTPYYKVLHSTPRRSRESSPGPPASKANALSARQIFWDDHIQTIVIANTMRGAIVQIQNTNVHTPRPMRGAIPRAQNLRFATALSARQIFWDDHIQTIVIANTMRGAIVQIQNTNVHTPKFAFRHSFARSTHRILREGSSG